MQQASIRRKPVPGAAPKVDLGADPPPYEDVAPAKASTPYDEAQPSNIVSPSSVERNVGPFPVQEKAARQTEGKLAYEAPEPPIEAQPELEDDLEQQLEHLQLEPGSEPLESVPSEPEPQVDEQKSPSKWKHAFDEVKHFAGGLISHPYEATKHYSVLRHGHGIVFYQGPYTSVTISIFSDQALPEDRQVWMQRRGYSGKTGLKIGTLGTRSAWINVTPALYAEASQLPHNDERAWQRDIQKFLKNAAGEKSIRNHRPRETHVLRIPHLAEDGYFRVVLCAGRKVLCPSPAFRLASTSTDPGHVRGASLSTMPLEIGVKIGSMIARSTAQTASGGIMQPAVTAYNNAVQPYQPGALTKTAVSTAYNATLQPKVNQTVQDVDQEYVNRQQAAHTLAAGEDVHANLLGSNSGPEQPFPIEFTGKVVAGTGATAKALGRPSANLEGISQDVELRLSGVYAAWAKVIAKTETKWLPAIIGVHPRTDIKATVVERRSIRVMVLREIGDVVGSKMSVMLVAFLHTSAFEANPDLEQRQLQLATYMSIVEESFARPNWTADAVLAQIKQQRADRSMMDKAADARRYGQKQVDKLNIHRVGVRTDSMGFRDQVIGNGGICVRRSFPTQSL